MWKRWLTLTSQRNCVRVANETMLDFCAIPTPKRLPIIGTTFDLIAAGAAPKLHAYVDRRHNDLGAIYRETLGSVEAVFLADPVDMRAVFNREGKHPRHVLPEAWIVYNQLFGCKRGLFFMDGEEWLHFRRIMNKLLLKSDSMQWLQEPCEHVATGLANRWRQTLKNNVAHVTNLDEQLYRLSIDTLIAVLLGDKYAECEKKLENDVAHLSSIVHLIFQTSAKLQLIPVKLAAKFKLPVWRKFVRAADDGLNIAHKLTERIIQECPKGNGLLSKMIDENIRDKDIARIVADLILAAGDTTAYSMQWIIYLLAKNSDVQQKLQQLSGDDEHTYVKSIIREGLRLYPVAPFLTRILPQDTTIAGYIIPNGTLVIMSLYSSSRNARYFPEPNRFWPERWLRNGVREFTAASPNASLPFAMGARSCIGRKIAETQMSATIKELSKHFHIQLTHQNDVNMILRMVAVPETPISIKITERK